MTTGDKIKKSVIYILLVLRARYQRKEMCNLHTVPGRVDHHQKKREQARRRKQDQQNINNALFYLITRRHN